MSQQSEKLKSTNRKLQNELDTLNSENTKKKNEELEARVSQLTQLCAELQGIPPPASYSTLSLLLFYCSSFSMTIKRYHHAAECKGSRVGAHA